MTGELQPAREIHDDPRGKLVPVTKTVEKSRDRALVADPAKRDRRRNLCVPIVEQRDEWLDGAPVADLAECAHGDHPYVP